MTRFVAIVKQFRGPRRGRTLAWGPWRDRDAAVQNVVNLRRRRDAAGIEADVVELVPGSKSAREIKDRLS